MGSIGYKFTRGITLRSAAAQGFTLVEILIVVVILGILATVVIPQFSNASHEAKENTLKDELRYLRTQLQVFKAQHRDIGAGYPGGVISAAPSSAVFTDQMTLHSDDACSTNAAATSVFKFGPYLTKVPENPLNGLRTIIVVANGGAIPVADGSTGWIYKPQTQEFIANLAGNDNTGTPYVKY